MKGFKDELDYPLKEVLLRERAAGGYYHRIHDNLYVPPKIIDIIFYMVYGIDTIVWHYLSKRGSENEVTCGNSDWMYKVEFKSRSFI